MKKSGKNTEFNSFLEAGLYFARVAALEKPMQWLIMKGVGKKLERKAKEKFGVYQEAVGEWPRWKALAERTKDDRAFRGFPPDLPLLVEGKLRASIYTEITRDNVIVGSSDQRMIWHEMGTDHIPPRPVLGPTLFENAHSIVNYVGKAMSHLVAYGFVDPPGEGL